MKNNQKGFSVVEILIVVVIVGLVGTVGWLVYDRQKSKSDDKDTAVQTSQQESSKNQTVTPKPVPNTGYLVVKEWGVKIKMKDADKVSYDYTAKVYENDKGKADSSIGLKVKPEFLENKSCEPSVSLTRYTSVSDEFFVKRATKIGNYYFISGGSPYNCGNDADNALNNSVRADFGNLEAL